MKRSSQTQNKTISKNNDQSKIWTSKSAEGRWCGFGPYYAMFPVEFAHQIISQYSKPGSMVIDPFCGRGTVPFVAMSTQRHSFACDINPVGWVYAKVKTDPFPDSIALISRVREIEEAIRKDDCFAENEFQKWAWSKSVLGYLSASRRVLNWKRSRLDRTLMGIILVHLHAKIGDGLSNQLRQSKAMSPDYSVRWWKERNMHPPKLDPVKFLTDKINWRYGKGIVSKENLQVDVKLCDASIGVKSLPQGFKSDLVFTSPPYCGVTNYRYDNWIRLWQLGEGPALPEYESSHRFAHRQLYQELLGNVFAHCSRTCNESANVYVRTDAREFTLRSTIDALRDSWPEKNIYFKPDKFKRPTQTALFGDKSQKPGEVDILLLPKGNKKPNDFINLPKYRAILKLMVDSA